MKFRIGCCQMHGSMAADMVENKKETRERAEKMIREAAANSCDFVALPEMWNTPYANRFFRDYAEPEDGETVQFMSSLAEEMEIYLVGGSISEITDEKVYNTSYVFDRKGKMIAKHRKAHLFDINVEGGIRFMESETLTAGAHATCFDTEFGKMGLAICFDVRFSEFFMKMSLEGAKVVFLPAAFNMTTGPVHWKISMQARAMDNQIFLAAISPARNMDGVYQAYGHTMVVDPWAEIVAEADEKEGIVYADVDLERIDSIRNQLPILSARKPELY